MTERGESILSQLPDDHLLCQSFALIEEGDYTQARDIFTDSLFEEGYSSSYQTTDFWGCHNDAWVQLFSDVVGVQFLIRKKCISCDETQSHQSHSVTYPLIAFYKNATNPKKLFGQVDND